MLIDKPEDRAFLMSAMRAVASAARTEGIEFQRWSVLDQAARQMGEAAPSALREAAASAERAFVRGQLRRISMSCFFSDTLYGQPTPAGKIPLGAEAEMSRIVKARQAVVEQCEIELRRIGDDQWSKVVAAVMSFANDDALDRAAKPLFRDALLTAEEAVEAVVNSWEGKMNASMNQAFRSLMEQERAEFAALIQEALRKIVT